MGVNKMISTWVVLIKAERIRIIRKPSQTLKIQIKIVNSNKMKITHKPSQTLKIQIKLILNKMIYPINLKIMLII